MVPLPHQLCAAREISFRKGEVGLGLSEIRLGLIERDLEWAPVDGEQEIALLDHLAVCEVDAVEVARYTGANFDAVDRNEAADIFILIDNHALDRIGDRDDRRWRCGGLLLRALAAARKQQDCK